MRVVAGELGGRKLKAPEGLATRPTSDRVREATFNALGSLGVVEDATVLDLFAGSGALGIEALSRGAASATFVEHDRKALAVLRANLASCGLAAPRAVVVAGGALPPPAGHFDLALLDPPYDFDGWPALLDAVDADVAVCESDRPVEPTPLWLVVRQKSYGATVVTVLRRGAGLVREE